MFITSFHVRYLEFPVEFHIMVLLQGGSIYLVSLAKQIQNDRIRTEGLVAI